MRILEELGKRNAGSREPFLIGPGGALSFDDVAHAATATSDDIAEINPGEVVALIGDFDGQTIATMLRLLDAGVILMPLTPGTSADHDYFLESGGVDWIIAGSHAERVTGDGANDGGAGSNPLLDELRARQHPGIIFFSSGTTGRPKAILHDFTHFLARYATPRPPLRALNFLLFDHAGGINTMLHTLFNRGVVIVPSERTPEVIASEIARHGVELLPATPTFLRMMLLAGVLETGGLPSLRVVTYGTERMDQNTLDRLCTTLPGVDFRQTYGLSELGVFQVRSRARDSLWMQIGGKGIETRVVDSVLHIRSDNRMLGYLNAPSPFTDGWYDTGDIVEQDGEFIKVTGRAKEILNVGGLKILPGEVERVALLHPDVLRAKAIGVANPITGQHIEVICEPRPGASLDRRTMMTHFRSHLQKQLSPHRVTIGEVAVSHRFKQK
ncbi:MAG: long-chain fatty acid--CoA ligase [Gemmatimonadaceae bacterium]|nr:long-chain fatty acid--CoA ligase [Gemmatimonadaceae bacterium]MDQ3242297.1 fatty acid--CoA ligase family protein [Gemmatimonadota bacterium]